MDAWAEFFEYLVEGVFLFITALLGLLGNILFIYIFNFNVAVKLKTFQSLMICLAYFDILYLSAALFVFSVPLLAPTVSDTFLFTHSITYLYPLTYMGLTGRGRNAM